MLAAPGRYVQYQATDAAIDKLLTVARQEFDNVVIDLGSKVDLTGTVLFKEASAIYLVTQAGIPELRNSNRLISQFFSAGGPKLEIVINRHETSALGVSEEAHHEGAYAAGEVENSERLCLGEADAGECNAAGADRFSDFTEDSADGQDSDGRIWLQSPRKRASAYLGDGIQVG